MSDTAKNVVKSVPIIGDILNGADIVASIAKAAGLKGKTPRLPWQEQDRLAIQVRDEILTKVNAAFPDNDLAGLHTILVKKSLSYIAGRNNPGNQRAGIMAGEIQGTTDASGCIWFVIMYKLDNVSTDKTDITNRLADVMRNVIQPAIDEFGNTLGVETYGGTLEKPKANTASMLGQYAPILAGVLIVGLIVSGGKMK